MLILFNTGAAGMPLARPAEILPNVAYESAMMTFNVRHDANNSHESDMKCFVG